VRWMGEMDDEIMQCMIPSMSYYTLTTVTLVEPINVTLLAVNAWYCDKTYQQLISNITLTYSDGSMDKIGYAFITLIYHVGHEPWLLGQRQLHDVVM